jgi:hypothetical protein
MGGYNLLPVCGVVLMGAKRSETAERTTGGIPFPRIR